MAPMNKQSATVNKNPKQEQHRQFQPQASNTHYTDI